MATHFLFSNLSLFPTFTFDVSDLLFVCFLFHRLRRGVKGGKRGEGKDNKKLFQIKILLLMYIPLVLTDSYTGADRHKKTTISDHIVLNLYIFSLCVHFHFSSLFKKGGRGPQN